MRPLHPLLNPYLRVILPETHSSVYAHSQGGSSPLCRFAGDRAMAGGGVFCDTRTYGRISFLSHKSLRFGGGSCVCLEEAAGDLYYAGAVFCIEHICELGERIGGVVVLVFARYRV